MTVVPIASPVSLRGQILPGICNRECLDLSLQEDGAGKGLRERGRPGRKRHLGLLRDRMLRIGRGRVGGQAVCYERWARRSRRMWRTMICAR